MKKILKISIGILLFIGLQSANAASLESTQKIFDEARGICKIYLKQCEPHLVISNQWQAVTHKEKDIYITSDLVKALTEDELRAVIYHEVGHAVLRHTTREANWLMSVSSNKTYTKEAHYNLRRIHEYEADRFASYTLKFTRRPNCLPEALFKIVPPEYWNVEFPTHPSVIDRVHKIKIIIDKGGI